MANHSKVYGALTLAEISQWENEGGAIVQSANVETDSGKKACPAIIAALLLASIAALAVHFAFS